MMSNDDDIKGPIIVWQDYGYEGWQPKSYPTLKDALVAQKYQEFVVTNLVEFDVVAITSGDRNRG